MLGYNPYYQPPQRQLPSLYEYQGVPRDLIKPVSMPNVTTPTPPSTGQSPEQLGGVMGAVGAGLGFINDQVQGVNVVKSLNVDAPQQQFDASGRPVFNAHGMVGKINSIDTRGVSAGEALGATAKGAAVGATFGPIGAAIGGLVGAVGSIVGGRARRRAARRKKAKAIRNFKGAQTTYNQGALAANQEEAAQDQYQELTNNQTRMRNLYSIGTNLY
jgi:Sec-independent protein translocase protein TatA